NCKNIYFSKKIKKIDRIIETLLMVINCKYIFLTSSSNLNKFAIFISKILKKHVYYIMHGSLSYEDEINGLLERVKQDNKYENFIFKNVDKIFCVSEKFMDFMKKREYKYRDKFDYNYNCLDYSKLIKIPRCNNYITDILLIGGDMPRKNNKVICDAIKKINDELSTNITCTVVGKNYESTNFFDKYDFVEYIEFLPRDKLMQLMGKSKLNILNSSFETFGLSIIEALIIGSSILISNKVGSIGILENVRETDIIYDTSDIEEISNKIRLILEKPNNNRLINSINLDVILPQNAAFNLLKKVGLNYEDYCK
uniref:glycosyltransferase n=1 Tax=Thomasclavelia sp. TaxID=3025757 RepID=UPI0025DD641F